MKYLALTTLAVVPLLFAFPRPALSAGEDAGTPDEPARVVRDDWWKQPDQVRIDWKLREIGAWGTAYAKFKGRSAREARIVAEEKADANAVKRLAKAVRTLRTSTGRPVGDYIGEIEAEETVRSAGTRTAPRYYDDGSVTIVVGMSLDEVDRKIAAFVTSRSSTEGVESPADGDWQNLSWGLTPSEVMRLRPDARKVGKRLAELKASVAGHPAKVVFLFVKGRLGGVRVLFDGSETNPAADLAIYQELRRLLTQKYGRPREANDEAWLTDNRSWRDMPRSGALAHGVLEYRTTWRKGGTHVQLTVSGGEKTELGLPRARANLKYVSVEMARAQKASVGKKRLNDL